MKKMRRCRIALCLRHETDEGITLDAVLHGDVDLAILFSYTRAYFRVDADRPYRAWCVICACSCRANV